jgi:hypothetical protein
VVDNSVHLNLSFDHSNKNSQYCTFCLLSYHISVQTDSVVYLSIHRWTRNFFLIDRFKGCHNFVQLVLKGKITQSIKTLANPGSGPCLSWMRSTDGFCQRIYILNLFSHRAFFCDESLPSWMKNLFKCATIGLLKFLSPQEWTTLGVVHMRFAVAWYMSLLMMLLS